MTPSSQPTPAPLVAIIDDEEDITTFVGLVFVDAGYRALVSNESASVLRMLREQRPSLICLDLLMPEQMGSSLFVEIRRSPELAGVPILILSGLTDQAEVGEMIAREGEVAAPDGYIEKPINPEHLLKVAAVLAPLDNGGEG